MAKKKLKSVFTDDMDHCYFTGSPFVERHHIFGASNKDKSENRDFIIPLRPDLHPNGANFKRIPQNMGIDLQLKQMAQKYYETHYGSRDAFRKEFGKSYL